MICLGFNTSVIKWFESFLPNRKFFVTEVNIFSEAGILNDDMCILCQGKDIYKIEDVLTKEFSTFCEWLVDSKLSIHFGEDKTKCILFFKTKR